jgi:cysteine-rich repeat protein
VGKSIGYEHVITLRRLAPRSELSLRKISLILLLTSACAISREKDEPRQNDRDAGVDESSDGSIFHDAHDRSRAADARDPEGTGGAAGNGAVAGGGSESQMAICGNGRLEGDETCDDGNLYGRDGCTTLCELSCEEDSDCDDLNDCNGIEICTSDGACDDSDPGPQEGAPCGADGYCWRGVCVRNICGDGKRDAGEACDDGNLDPDDGCTPDCELTCEEDSDCSDKDACRVDSLCRDDGRHGGLRVCTGGTPLADRTECEIKDAKSKALCGDPEVDKDGWCIKGICTCSGCGDGEVDETEACDDGPLNGTTDSPNNCALNCRVVACGNDVLEGDEECEDGNDRPMDGCDPSCRYEFAHRFTGMRILKEVDVPKWCKHRNNRFADAFSEEVPILGFTSLNMLEVVNRQFNSHMATGDSFYVLQILDSNDTSMNTVDDDITVGLYQGHRYENTPTDDTLDAPVIIDWSHLNAETLLPAEYHALPALQAGGGRVISRGPTVVEIATVAGDFAPMYDFMMQLVFDVSRLSRPQVEPFEARDTITVSEALRIPEVAGQNPTGLFCGAIGEEYRTRSIVERPPTGAYFGPMDSRCCKNRGDEIGKPYRSCDNGVLTDQCESVADLIRQGCTVCLDTSSIEDMLNGSGNSCDLMETDSAACFTLLSGIEYDVDSDGDGENDSWSALFGFETERIRIYAAEEE